MRELLFVKFGSHVYGTTTPDSDTDYKGIFVPTPKSILLCQAPENVRRNTKVDRHAKNKPEDIDIEMFSIHSFLEQLMEGQTFAMDMIFTPKEHTIRTSEEWEFIKENRNEFLQRDVRPFFGYARKQASKYGVKGSRVNVVKAMLDVFKQLNPESRISEHESALRLVADQVNNDFIDRMNNRPLVTFDKSPHEKDHGLLYLTICDKHIPFTNKVKVAVQMLTHLDENYGERARKAATNEGIDWKALSHAIRVGEEGIELLKTGNITFPRPNAEYLTKVKTGKFSYEEVSARIEEVFQELIEAEKSSKLPAEPNREKATSIILAIHSQAIATSAFSGYKKVR